MANKTDEKNGMQGVETALNRTEMFFENNKKTLLIAFIAIVVIVLGIILYANFIRKPKIAEAQTELYKAEFAFEAEDYELALNGNDEFSGFAEIIDEYGSTPSGNAARYYAGVCYMRLGEYENAIDCLKKFSSKDPMIGPMATNLIGDANAELGNLDKAAEYYVKAAKQANNEYLSPIFLMKAGNMYELTENYAKALEQYKNIEANYYRTPEQSNIEKYIERAELKLNK